MVPTGAPAATGTGASSASGLFGSSTVSGCFPSCGGWVLVGVATSRTKIFKNQNHRLQFKFAYCKLFGVYAGVISTRVSGLLDLAGTCGTWAVVSYIA